jgi:TPP-dependent pyruvate/acetoin dehydrogenase alpha subunit
MGGHSTSDDPTRYVPAAELEAWEEKDPVRWFERYLARRELWDEGVRKRLEGEVLEEVDAAAKQAEKTPGPGLETVFSDVYQDLPAHLRRQGQESFDLAKRLGDPSAGDGAFPL